MWRAPTKSLLHLQRSKLPLGHMQQINDHVFQTCSVMYNNTILHFHSIMLTAHPGGTIVHFDTIKPARRSPHPATPNHGSPSVACQHQQAVVGSTTPSSIKIPPHIPSTTDVEHLCQYNNKYLGTKDYNPISAQLGRTFYTKLCSLHMVGTANSIKGLNYCTTLDKIS